MRIVILGTMVAAAVTMWGCDPGSNEGAKRGGSARSTIGGEAELRRADAERNVRVQVEAELVHERSNASWWQTVATFLGVAAVTLFFAGIMIGSSARNESEG